MKAVGDNPLKLNGHRLTPFRKQGAIVKNPMGTVGFHNGKVA